MTVTEEFQKIFNKTILPYIKTHVIPSHVTEPLFYTLEKTSNKFRSATALLAASLCQGKAEDVLPIAAVSEIIHSSIIIQDDIVDNDTIRRGKEAAWKKYGLCFALHSSLHIIPECFKLLARLQSPHADQIIERFMQSYQEVCIAQSDQSLMPLVKEIPYKSFLDIHLGKTVLGRFAITTPALFYGKEKEMAILEEFASKLGDAGTLKNDLEDFLDDGNFEPFCSDIREGNTTYPIYYFFSQCSEEKQRNFLNVYGKNVSHDFLKLKKEIIGKGAVSHCEARIKQLVESACALLTNFPDSPEKKLLMAWAEYHII